MSETSKGQGKSMADETEPGADTSSAETPAADTSSAETPAAAAPPAERRRREPRSKTDKPGKVKSGSRAVRRQLASLIWLVAVICALFLAVGALLIALDANQDNSIVKFVLDGADILDGPFSRDNGIFTFDGKDAATKSALVNWGLAAVVYLIIGKILDKIIRP